MTYTELLETTATKKADAIRQLNKALRDPSFGFLAKAEIERKPGAVAWHWLAKEFCQTIAEHIDELIDSAGSIEKDEILHIYYAYYDDDPNIYELLPVEAQLFSG